MTLPGFLHHPLSKTVPQAICALVMLAVTGGAARAQTADLVQDLYRDALRSIAEGRRDDATDALERVIAQEPLHAGAWLDLALVRCDLGNMAEAERLFQAIEQRFAPPPEIRELIARPAPAAAPAGNRGRCTASRSDAA